MPAVREVPYDPVKSLTPIAKVGSGPFAFVAHLGVPVNSAKELIALAKHKPGQLIFASSGVGGSAHMGIELFRIMAGIDIKVVQFKGGGPAMIDVLGGHSHTLFCSLLQALPHIKSSQVKVLGTSGSKRSSALPDVPTIAEAGLSGYESGNWWAFYGPPGMPAPIVNRLSKELKEIMVSDEIIKRFLNEGADVDYLGPTEFRAFLEAEVSKWERVVKKANIKLEE